VFKFSTTPEIKLKIEFHNLCVYVCSLIIYQLHISKFMNIYKINLQLRV